MTGRADLQSRWRSEQVLHRNAITFASGRVVLLQVSQLHVNARTLCVASPLAETTADSILGFDGDAWVTVTPAHRLQLDNDRELLAGEGAMGNEGFIALTQGGDLLWVLFCDTSNPFEDLHLADDDHQVAVAFDGYDGEWRVPLENPEEFSIRHAAHGPVDVDPISRTTRVVR